MSEKSKTVCFTGHRILHDPKELVVKRLNEVIRECISDGKTVFVTGGAIGFDYVKKKIM